jgi:Amt family ammonium transporter
MIFINGWWHKGVDGLSIEKKYRLMCFQVGAILTGFFAEQKVIGMGHNETIHNKGGWVDGHFYQIVPQLVGSFVGALWVFVITALLVWGMGKIRIPWFGGRQLSLSLRMSQEDEVTGTDFSLMGEVACKFMMMHI